MGEERAREGEGEWKRERDESDMHSIRHRDTSRWPCTGVCIPDCASWERRERASGWVEWGDGSGISAANLASSLRPPALLLICPKDEGGCEDWRQKRGAKPLTSADIARPTRPERDVGREGERERK
jgi:hypothetical protein